MNLTRYAPFAFRVVDKRKGRIAIIYRRKPDHIGRDRLQRIAALSPLALTAGTSLLKDAAVKSIIAGRSPKVDNPLAPGKFHPMDSDWGSRVACFAIICAKLRSGERMLKAASHLREADGNEAAWWLGMLQNGENIRALRALRILTEAAD